MMLRIYYHTCPSSLCQISDQSRFSKRSNWQKRKHLDFWTKKWLFRSKVCHFGFKILIKLISENSLSNFWSFEPKRMSNIQVQLEKWAKKLIFECKIQEIKARKRKWSAVMVQKVESPKQCHLTCVKSFSTTGLNLSPIGPANIDKIQIQSGSRMKFCHVWDILVKYSIGNSWSLSIKMV